MRCVFLMLVTLGSSVGCNAFADGPILEFATMFATNFGCEPYDIAVDSTGSVYATGYAPGGFNGETNVGGWDCFLIKLDKNGSHLWTRIWGSSAIDIGRGVFMGKSNDLYVAGLTLGSFDNQTNYSNQSPFLSKFDVNGNRAWSRIWGTSPNSWAGDGCLASNSEICVVGSANSNFDGNTNVSDQCFITRFNSEGTKLSSTMWGDASMTPQRCVADGFLNIYVMGDIWELGVQNVFLTKIDASGSNVWQDTWGSVNWDRGRNVCLGASNDVYVCGNAAGPIDGQPCPFPQSAFLSRFDTNGTREWTRIYSWSSAQGCALHPSGGVYLVGHTDFSHFDYINPGTSSHYAAWINQDGACQWFRSFGSDEPDGAFAVDHYDGSAYVLGSSWGNMMGQTNPNSGIYSAGIITKWSEKDSDSDGIPDIWENLHSLNPLSSSDATNDSDTDGVINLMEFLTGTDPQNPSSKLEMTSLSYSNDECYFEWSGGIEARQYLKFTTNIMMPIDEWQTIYTNPAPTASSVSFSYMPASSNRIGYFSLEAGR